MKALKIIAFVVAFVVAGCVGSGVGLWLALPAQCLTMDNLTQYTAECYAAQAARRQS